MQYLAVKRKPINMGHHLFYDIWTADTENVKGHPQSVMAELGITYQIAVPQSVQDGWQFWNCENIPVELPSYLTIQEWDPMKFIGWGLSQKDAEKIRDYEPRTED